MKVLVVEDAPEIADFIHMCFNIRWPGTVMVATEKGSDGAHLVQTEAPDIVIFGLGLLDADGHEVLREIRRFSDVPVIIVSARGDEVDRVKGLEMGSDDYIVKPFYPTELLARVRAVLRRTRMPELMGDPGVANGRGLSVDLAGYRLLVDGHEVTLTPTEWKLLSYFVRNEGRVASHRLLAEKVWGAEYPDGSAIKMCVRRLRVKPGDDPHQPRIIRSHRGIGYSFSMLR